MSYAKRINTLLTEEGRGVLKKYFVTCSGCGLVGANRNEDVCPVCGSTSWGWNFRGLGFVVALSAVGIFGGELLGYYSRTCLSVPNNTWLAMGLCGLSLAGPVYQFLSGRVGEEIEYTTLVTLLVVAAVPVIIMHLPGLPAAPRFPLFQYFGLVWVFFGFDRYLASRRKSLSLCWIIQCIEAKRRELEKNLVQISEELSRLERSPRSEVMRAIREKLDMGVEMIKRELPRLEADRTYTVGVGMFFFWKNCLLEVSRNLHRIPLSDVGRFEEINLGLEIEISKTQPRFEKALAEGREGAGEIRACIERSLAIHDMIRETLAARRARHALASVKLLPGYEVPDQVTPLVLDGLDCSSEIIDQLNASYHQIKLDSDVNDLMRGLGDSC